MCPPQRRGRHFRQAEMADLSLPHEIGHRADRLLDRHRRVDAVQIVHVDVRPFSAGATTARTPRGRTSGRPSIRSSLPICVLHEAELRRQHDVGAPALDGLTDLQLRITIDVGGIEKGDAEIEGTPNQARSPRRHHGRRWCRSVADPEAHTAETDGRYARPQDDRAVVDSFRHLQIPKTLGPTVFSRARSLVEAPGLGAIAAPRHRAPAAALAPARVEEQPAASVRGAFANAGPRPRSAARRRPGRSARTRGRHAASVAPPCSRRSRRRASDAPLRAGPRRGTH